MHGDVSFCDNSLIDHLETVMPEVGIKGMDK